MRILTTFAFVAMLTLPALAGDLVIKQSKHTDAMKIMGQDKPAEDSTSVTWFGKDRMRMEEGDKVTIVRGDLKKMYQIDTKAKTYTAIDLPLDMKKYIPAEQLEMMQPFLDQIKVTVTPTTETKKIKDWNATKYTMTMTLPMGSGFTQTLWATKDIAIDRAGLDMQSSMMTSMMGLMGGANFATEMKKIEGFVVLSEQTQNMMGSEVKSKEEVTSVETKDPTEGLYDLPKDFKEVPFDPMADSPMGGGGGRPHGKSGGRPGGPPPGEKPKERPPVPQPK